MDSWEFPQIPETIFSIPEFLGMKKTPREWTPYLALNVGDLAGLPASS